MKSGVVCVTGGAGYVGLHTAASLLQAGHAVLCIDNLKNSKVTGINRLRERHKNLLFSYCDLRETSSLEEVFGRHNVSLVIHCAGSKNVGESTRIPLEYYHNNVESTISLLQVIEKQEIRRLILSSSSTVYGRAPAPHDEASTPCIPVCPYGNTKMFVETMLRDYCAAADESFQAIVFRYFNPGGAHPTGIVGEDELHTSNLIPLLFEVCLGKRSEFVVFGSDYETSDGTCQRDFFHIMDLAEAHVAAVDFINPGFHVFDLGSGIPTSVLEVVYQVENVSGKKVPLRFGNRRVGDIPVSYCRTEKAQRELGWGAKRKLKEICEDQWNFLNSRF